jgi:hypothetical protein
MSTPTQPTRPIDPIRMDPPTRHDGSAPTLALISAVAAGGVIVDALLGMLIPALAYDGPPVWWDAALRAVLHLGQLAAALAVGRAGLAGSGLSSRIGLGLWIAGSACYTAGELVYLIAAGPADAAFGIGSLAMLIGMVMTGLGVLRTGRWTGPGRFLPLVTGLYVIPLTVVLVATNAALVALAGYSMLWLLLSLSLYFATRIPLRSGATRAGSR